MTVVLVWYTVLQYQVILLPKVSGNNSYFPRCQVYSVFTRCKGIFITGIDTIIGVYSGSSFWYNGGIINEYIKHSILNTQLEFTI
jgi:hypothetical protein